MYFPWEIDEGVDSCSHIVFVLLRLNETDICHDCC